MRSLLTIFRYVRLNITTSFYDTQDTFEGGECLIPVSSVVAPLLKLRATLPLLRRTCQCSACSPDIALAVVLYAPAISEMQARTYLARLSTQSSSSLHNV